MIRGVLKIVELTAVMVLPVTLILAPASPAGSVVAAAATFFLAVATFVLYAEAMRLSASVTPRRSSFGTTPGQL